MEQEIEKEANRLRNLASLKKLNDEEIYKKAFTNIKVKDFQLNHDFLDSGEEASAKLLYSKYLESYEFDNVSDFSTLGDLVVNEIQKKRIETSIGAYYEKQRNKENAKSFVPDKLLKTKQELENHILILKKRLGIDREDIKQDDLTALQTLQQRFEKYIQENKHEFTTACSKCGNLLLLRQRVKDFDVLQHPWFIGRWFFNYEILTDVKYGKLSKEDAWRYMCCASKGANHKPAFSKEYCTDYIDYCLKNWNEITRFFKEEK